MGCATWAPFKNISGWQLWIRDAHDLQCVWVTRLRVCAAAEHADTDKRITPLPHSDSRWQNTWESVLQSSFVGCVSGCVCVCGSAHTANCQLYKCKPSNTFDSKQPKVKLSAPLCCGNKTELQTETRHQWVKHTALAFIWKAFKKELTPVWWDDYYFHPC